MTAPSWTVTGQYYDTCSCDYLCPCLLHQLAAEPTKGTCTFVMAFQIDNGTFGSESLNGLGFIVLAVAPEAMVKGNWSVGVIVEERATPAQRDAITSIASGSAGGPMAAVSGLVGQFLGVESAPIQFERDGAKWSVTAASFVDIAAQAAGINPEAAEPLHLDHTGHPAADRIALARGLKSHVDALGLSWNDTSGKNHGQYAPFNWSSA
jgi:hypothetical protein